MESGPTEEEKLDVEPKHKDLQEDKKDEVELVVNQHTKNVACPFINQTKSWDDEELNLSDDIKHNLIDILKFEKPSKIQAVTIPMIVLKAQDAYQNLIALAPTGCGKTGAYGVGSLLRVDR